MAWWFKPELGNDRLAAFSLLGACFNPHITQLCADAVEYYFTTELAGTLAELETAKLTRTAMFEWLGTARTNRCRVRDQILNLQLCAHRIELIDLNLRYGGRLR